MSEKFDSGFYKRILNQIHSNIYITDVETDEIVFMNDFMKDAYNIAEPEGQICWKILQEDMEERCDFCKIPQLLENTGEKEIVWKEYSPITKKTYMNYDTTEEWEGRRYHIQNYVDITENIKLSKDASIDELTTLFNRQTGRKKLEETLKKLKRDEHFIVVLYDINGLKWVNDTYGHIEGDRLLRYVATSMKNNLDESDFIFRLSGDEFIVVFMNKEIYQAENWMKKMLQMLEKEKQNVGIYYEVSFSYGLAKVRGEERLGVSDVLSIADTQMYIQKRDYHIAQGKKRLHSAAGKNNKDKQEFKYSQEYLFDAFSDSVDGYAFIGNLKTGEFMYSYKMVLDFGLPKQVLSDAASFWGEIIHPEDRDFFLKSNQEIADGKAEKHTISYRAKNIKGEWVNLLCKGKMIRDKEGKPDLFAGVIYNLDNRKISRNFSDSDRSSFYFAEEASGKASAELEERLINFVSSNIPGGVMATHDDEEFSFICFNQALLEYTNCTYEELMQKTGGKNLRAIYEEDRKRVCTSIKKQLKEKGEYEITYRIVRNDNEFLWVYEVGRYAINEDGEKCILAFYIDISDEKEKESELRFINKNSTGGVFKAVMTEGFPILYANDGYYQIHGYTKKQMEDEIQSKAVLVMHPEDIDQINQKIEAKILKKEKQVVLEYRIIKRDGSIAWVHVDGTLLNTANGSSVMVGMIMDITNRHLLEEKLSHTKELYKLVRNHTKLNVWEFDIENRKIIMENIMDNSLQSVRITENVPESIIEIGRVHPDSIQAFREMHEKVINGEEKVSATIQIRKNNGEYQWEKITYVCFKDNNNKSIWAVGISEDITAQKEAEIRAFNQEKLSEILVKDYLYSFRINISKNCLETAWNENGDQLSDKNRHVTCEEVYEKICDVIANEDDKKRFKKYCSPDQILKYKGNFTKEFEFRQMYENEKIIWVNFSLKLIESPSTGEKILFAYARNIDTLKRRELSLQKKVEMDEISGLYNPYTTKLLVENIFEDKNKKVDESVFMIINVDNFKRVNRIGGFAAGDNLLKQIGEVIRRKSSPSSIIGRLSSDTFVAYIYGLKTKKAVYNEVHKMQEVLNRVYTCDNLEFDITVSIGAVYLFTQDEVYERIYEAAYQAIEAAKQKGGNAVVFYEQIKIEENKRFMKVQETDLISEDEEHKKVLDTIFHQSWSRIENGEKVKNVCHIYLEYIGKCFDAREVTLLKRKKSDELFIRESWWNSREKGEAKELSTEKIYYLYELFDKISPSQSVFISRKEDPGYEEVLRMYEIEKLDHPVFIAGQFENDRLVYALIIEKCNPRIESMKIAEYVLEMIRRIEYLHDVRESYEYVMYHDNITDSLNYESYKKRLEYMNEDTLITLGMVGVRMVDLKNYNQKYGADKGDESLLFVANLLSRHFGRNNCYRVGRTSFITLCEDIPYKQFFERYREVQEQIDEAYSDWIVMTSAWEQHVISVEKMQNQIEEKLKIEQNRKNIDDNSVNKRAALEVLNGIQNTIKERKFCTFLQPKADVHTGEICGAEALIRFKDKEKGIIPPGRFLPAIEKAGLIRYVDLFILEDVCRMLKEWMEKGKKPFPISLNYSRATILEQRILEETNRIVESYGIPKELIEIEITESIGSIDRTSLKNIVDLFVEDGYRVALDDYGAEYSNVYILYSLQLNTLKLDRQIVNDIYHDKKARIVAENVINVCKKLGIVCVAEGVETKEHLEVLKEMSCDMIQGYYINKPLPEEEFYKQYYSE